MIYLSTFISFISNFVTAIVLDRFILGLTPADGLAYNFSLMFVLDALCIVSYIFALRKEHKQSVGVRALIIIDYVLLGLNCVFVACSGGNQELLLGYLIAALLTLVYVILLRHYWKTGDVVEPDVPAVKQPARPSELPQASAANSAEPSIQTVLSLLRFIQSVEPYSGFDETIQYLTEIQKKGIAVRKALLGQLTSLLTVYRNNLGQRVCQETSAETMEDIRNSFSMVNQALAKMYDDSFVEESYAIDAEITALESKLKSDNLIDTDIQLKL